MDKMHQPSYVMIVVFKGMLSPKYHRALKIKTAEIDMCCLNIIMMLCFCVITHTTQAEGKNNSQQCWNAAVKHTKKLG